MRLAIALTALLVAASPANAGFSVCNNSHRLLAVALGYFNGNAWASEGWWRLPPSNCSELIQGPLKGRYYYLYATDGAFISWDGDSRFCVAVAAKFSIVGREACSTRELEQRGFFEIDTGNQLNWTHTISDPK